MIDWWFWSVVISSSVALVGITTLTILLTWAMIVR